MDVAKVFWSGRSQAVRLPREFRFIGSEVRIRRHGSKVILEPIEADWRWLDELSGPLDADAQEAAAQQPAVQERAALDALFR